MGPFLLKTLMLRAGFNFWWSLAAAIAATLVAYAASVWLLARWK